MRSQRHGSGGPLAHVDAAPLPGDNQSFLAEQPHCLLDGHARRTLTKEVHAHAGAGTPNDASEPPE